MNQKGYILQRDNDDTIFTSRDVRFNERCFPHRHPSGSCDAHKIQGETKREESVDKAISPSTFQSPKTNPPTPEDTTVAKISGTPENVTKAESYIPTKQETDQRLNNVTEHQGNTATNPASTEVKHQRIQQTLNQSQ